MESTCANTVRSIVDISAVSGIDVEMDEEDMYALEEFEN